METFSMLLAICAGNSPVTGQFPAQRPKTRSFDVFFDLRLNKRLSKQLSGWWFETRSRPLWRHCNAMRLLYFACILLRISSSIMSWCSEHNVILWCYVPYSSLGVVIQYSRHADLALLNRKIYKTYFVRNSIITDKALQVFMGSYMK